MLTVTGENATHKMIYVCMLVHKKIGYHHFIIYYLSIHSAKHTPLNKNTISQKKMQYHMFFYSKILRASWNIFFWAYQNLILHSLPPTTTTILPSFFWIPQPWWELSKAGFDFQFMIEAKQLPGVPPGGFFGKSWRTSRASNGKDGAALK